MDNNDFNKPSTDTPNYYDGGVPQPTQQPPNPYLNQPYPPQPYGAPQHSPSPYVQPIYQQPQMSNFNGTAPAQPSKSGVISLVVSLLSLMFFAIIPVINTVSAIVGIVYGHKALKETKDTYNSGRGLAIAGLICGYTALVMSFVWTLFVLLWIVAMASGYSNV